MFMAFTPNKLKPDSLVKVGIANSIIDEYRRIGMTLTLRQLYYQFVARGHIPNNLQEYKALGDLISKARLAGLVDWSAIEDRTRNVATYDGSDTGPEDAIHSAASGYRERWWKDQPYHVEVWVEKEALSGVIAPACGRWRLHAFSCRGYVSQSEQFRAGRRLAHAQDRGQTPLILHLGDHDPSGIDMTRDNLDRLAMFAEMGVEVRRLALNWDQVKAYNPPPNPAKTTDSRAGSYIKQFGRQSWELDALEPRVIDKLIDDEVRSVLDEDAWQQSEAHEEENRETLERIATNYDRVVAFLDDEGL